MEILITEETQAEMDKIVHNRFPSLSKRSRTYLTAQYLRDICGKDASKYLCLRACIIKG